MAESISQKKIKLMISDISEILNFYVCCYVELHRNIYLPLEDIFVLALKKVCHDLCCLDLSGYSPNFFYEKTTIWKPFFEEKKIRKSSEKSEIS